MVVAVAVAVVDAFVAIDSTFVVVLCYSTATRRLGRCLSYRGCVVWCSNDHNTGLIH